MKGYWLLLMIFFASWHSHAQIDAVAEDSVLDEYYINYPLDTGMEYHIHDTVAAVYYSRETVAEELIHLVFWTLPTGKHKPLFIVWAIVTDIHLDSVNGTHQYISGLKLKVFRIDRYQKQEITYVNEYARPDGCSVIVNSEKWYDVHDWRNVTGLYRIRKFTDNYTAGDTVSRWYSTEPSLLGDLFGTGRSHLYTITAVVRDMDTTERQALLLEIISIDKPYTDGLSTKEPAQDSMLYNYVNIHEGDLVWTKPYYWLKAGQHTQVNDGRTIPGGTRYVIGCQGVRYLLYDCEGNRYTPD